MDKNLEDKIKNIIKNTSFNIIDGIQVPMGDSGPITDSTEDVIDEMYDSAKQRLSNKFLTKEELKFIAKDLLEVGEFHRRMEAENKNIFNNLGEKIEELQIKNGDLKRLIKIKSDRNQRYQTDQTAMSRKIGELYDTSMKSINENHELKEEIKELKIQNQRLILINRRVKSYMHSLDQAYKTIRELKEKFNNQLQWNHDLANVFNQLGEFILIASIVLKFYLD